MPAIGTLPFSVDRDYDSGIALRLLGLPAEEIDETYNDTRLLASPSTPYVVCRFNGATDRADAISRGTELLQRSLDLHSMLGRADLHVKDMHDEHLVWWRVADLRRLAFTSTITFTARLGPVQLIVKDAEGNVIPPATIPTQYHIGFRFFRLAQIADDLHDAFRNMYLAFESLLSAKHPKGKEFEVQWLERALTASEGDLSLRALCPTAEANCASYILSIVYTGARLPLFHAKDGKTYFAPGVSDTDRAAVQAALKLLTELVIRMANVWFSARRRSGWVNLKLFEEGFRTQLASCDLVYSDEPTELSDLKDEVKSQRAVEGGISFPAIAGEEFDGVPRTNVTATLDVRALGSRTKLHALYVVKDGEPLMGVTPDTVITVHGLDVISVCLFLRGRNGNQPKSQFAR